MSEQKPVKVAVIQRPPVALDLKASLAAAIASVEEAAAEGAKLLVFPETYLPGYPTWMWRLRPGNDIALTTDIHVRLREQSVDIDGGDLDPLQEAAARHGVVIVMGLNELDNQFSGSTLYNTVVIIDADGRIANRHRKIMPTNPERMVWGQGDGSGLNVVETAMGRIGALICWENYMPLVRYALYAQNIDIYVAPTWDDSDSWAASMQHIAKEGGCWVLSSATALEEKDIPADFPGREDLFGGDDWINSGNAVIVKPGGSVAAGPHHRDKSILYGEIDVSLARRARRSLDVAGHYGRPDIFKLEVNRQPLPPVDFKD